MAELAQVAQIGGQAQYRPLDSRVSDWNAMTQNQRNYLESKERNERQQQIADKLAEINALGLPKNLQADIQAKRDELIEGVRSGKIDPYSYDFTAQAKGVLGYGLKTQADYNNALKLAVADGQVVEYDKARNPIDLKEDYANTILSQDITPEQLNTLLPKLQQQTPALDIPEKEIQDWIKAYNEMNSDERSKLTKGDFGMLNKRTVAQLGQKEREALYSTIEQMAGLSLDSKYASLNKGGMTGGKSLADWKKAYVTNLLPQEQVITTQVDDKLAQEEQKQSLKNASDKEKEGFSYVETPVDLSITDPLIEMEAGEGARKLSIKGALEKLNPDGDLDLISIKEIKVVPKKKGEGLKEIDIKGTVGTLSSVYVDKNGRGMAVIDVPISTTTGTTKDGGTSTKQKGTSRQTVQLRPEDTKYIKEFYGLEDNLGSTTRKLQFDENGNIII